MQAASGDCVADRVLHPGVGGNDKTRGSPRAQPYHESREPVHPLPEDTFAEQEDAEKSRFDEEGEGSLHRQGLRNDLAGVSREARPVGSELKLQRDAGHDTYDNGNGADPAPAVCSSVKALFLATQV